MNETLSVLQHTLQASVSPYHCIMEASRQLEEAASAFNSDRNMESKRRTGLLSASL